MIIPAHDEESVIGRCLAALGRGARPGELEVVVACNGCSDRTAEVARASMPGAVVLELAEAGKAAALNAADAVATAYPRIYLDADVELGIDAVRALCDALGPGGVSCAAPRPAFELEGRPWAIRAFYRAWQALPYLTTSVVGSGVYALSQEGRARFGEFPELTADDQYVLELFAPEERATLAGHSFVVHAPRSLGGLVRMRQRVYRGNRELAAAGSAGPAGPGRARSLAGLALRRPALLPALLAYTAINAVAEARSHRVPAGGWERDDSARQVAGTAPPRVGYLVSRYPSVSHTFVAQEVDGVRRAGLDVETFSIRRSPPEELLSERDRREAAATWSVLPAPAWRVAAAHLLTLARHPRAWLLAAVGAVRHGAPGVRGRTWQLLYFAEAVLLWRRCRRAGVRHLHAHLANVAADVARCCAELGQLAEPGAGWGWSFTMHGPAEFFDVSSRRLAAKVASADLVVAISDFARSQLMAVSAPADWPKIHVVHMGADLERWGRPATPARERRPGRLRILSVGRLDPLKGQAVLVDAVEALLAGGVDCSLWLVGEGPARPELERRIAAAGLGERVELLGALGHDDLPAWYAAADVFCMASFAEGVPVVLMEAMACRLAVVATRINGIPELIEDGVSGLLVAPGRPDLLAAALSRLVDPDVRAGLAAEGRRVVEESFDAARCGAEVAELLRQVAAPAT